MFKKTLLILLFPTLIYSQTSVTKSVLATVNVFPYMSLNLTSNGFADFRFNNNNELTQGITLPNKFNVNVISNRNWVLNVSTLTSSFLALGPEASSQMPPSILSIRSETTPSFVPLSNNPVPVATGTRGDATSSSNQFKLDLKATPGYDYNNGAYTIVLLFTLSAQ